MTDKGSYDERSGCILLTLFFISEAFIGILTFILIAGAWPPSKVMSGMEGWLDIAACFGAAVLSHLLPIILTAVMFLFNKYIAKFMSVVVIVTIILMFWGSCYDYSLNCIYGF